MCLSLNKKDSGKNLKCYSSGEGKGDINAFFKDPKQIFLTESK